MSWDDIDRALAAIITLCPSPLSITFAAQKVGLRIARDSGYSIYDALILAVALKAGGETLFSEDLQHSQVIDDRLTILNPFT